MNLTSVLSTSLLALASGMACPGEAAQAAPAKAFQPTWQSLRENRTPQWLRDGKFGIYTHWGVYAVPAMGPNATWYSHNLYFNPSGFERLHHEATYGPLEKFGYKDFIPMFTAERFNADEWADLWVEQEIAIAAFLKQAQKRDLQVAVYTQRGLEREGVRDYLHLNPVEFDTEQEVIDDFRARLRDGRFNPVRLQPPKDVDLQLNFKTVSRGDGNRHHYRLKLVVTNTGTERLTDYWVELQFPKAVLVGDPTISGVIKYRDTPTDVFLRADGKLLLSLA